MASFNIISDPLALNFYPAPAGAKFRYHINNRQLMKKLTPKFILVNACIPMVYKETENILRFLHKIELITV